MEMKDVISVKRAVVGALQWLWLADSLFMRMYRSRVERLDVSEVSELCEPLTDDYYNLTLAPRRVKMRYSYSYVLFRVERAPSFCRMDAILDYYRPQHSFHRALASVLRLHNETGNIWSHLLGEIL
jgi:hypothetical protein